MTVARRSRGRQSGIPAFRPPAHPRPSRDRRQEAGLGPPPPTGPTPEGSRSGAEGCRTAGGGLARGAAPSDHRLGGRAWWTTARCRRCPSGARSSGPSRPRRPTGRSAGAPQRAAGSSGPPRAPSRSAARARRSCRARPTRTSPSGSAPETSSQKGAKSCEEPRSGLWRCAAVRRTSAVSQTMFLTPAKRMKRSSSSISSSRPLGGRPRRSRPPRRPPARGPRPPRSGRAALRFDHRLQRAVGVDRRRLGGRASQGRAPRSWRRSASPPSMPQPWSAVSPDQAKRTPRGSVRRRSEAPNHGLRDGVHVIQVPNREAAEHVLAGGKVRRRALDREVGGRQRVDRGQIARVRDALEAAISVGMRHGRSARDRIMAELGSTSPDWTRG